MFNLAQKSLVGTRIQFNDELLVRASLFPMFTETGAVKTLLLVDHTRDELYSSPWVQGMVRKPFFGYLQVKRTRQSWDAVTRDKGYQLTNLWHFDPWWVLAETGFCHHPATPPLKTTNSVAEVTGIKSLYFARDLSRVAIWLNEAGELKSFEEGKFRPRTWLEDPCEPNFDSQEWRLRPFWESRRTAI